MSQSWIKMGTGLRRHPKVVLIASALRADRLRVVGALHAVWCVFDEHSVDGALPGYTLAVMDEEIGWRGFSAAMAGVGWLEQTACDLAVPDYEEHNGPTAKRRASETKRKAENRAETGDDRTKSERMADTAQTESGQVSASTADKKRARGEEIREEPSEANASGAKAPPPSPRDMVFALGVPLLTAAGVKESNARSFLAAQSKAHGDAALAAALEQCAVEKPIQPVPWLQTHLKPKASGRHTGFAAKDYREGVTEDGSIA